MIEEGFRNINSKGSNGKSPLYKAIERRNFNVVKYLIEKGADVNAECNEELSKKIPLTLAVQIGDLRILKHLLLLSLKL